MKKVLVVVDVQKDFYHPDGAMYVKGGEILPEKIAKMIPLFDTVIFTVDWHPINHCSFKEHGGTWNAHCVAYTEGANLPQEFMPFIKGNIITKGEYYGKEEYHANPKTMANMGMLHCENDYEMVFCGIAGDYCLKETIDYMIAYQKVEESMSFVPSAPKKISVYLDGVVSFDDGTTIRTFMQQNNIDEWKPEE